MTTNELNIFLGEKTEQGRLAALNAAIEASRQNRVPIHVDDRVAAALIDALKLRGSSNGLKANIWRAISVCGPNEILDQYCEEALSSQETNLWWQDHALQHLVKNTAGPTRARYLEHAAASSNYCLRFTAAVEEIETNTQESLKRMVDICEVRDQYDHGTYEALTFWIDQKGDASLIPYLESKIHSTGNPDVISDLSAWVEMLSDR